MILYDDSLTHINEPSRFPHGLSIWLHVYNEILVAKREMKRFMPPSMPECMPNMYSRRDYALVRFSIAKGILL